MSSLWRRAKGIPPGPAAVLESLRFDWSAHGPIESLTGEDWREALAFSDRAQLTLLLAGRERRSFPAWVCERLDRNLADARGHQARVESACAEACEALERAGVDFLVLKGFAHAPGRLLHPRLRIQYDIDLYCPDGGLLAARDTLAGLGYTPVPLTKGHPVDHLPTMIRDGNWKWNGNYFDPELPIAIDLHYRLWDRETEAFEIPGLEQFWPRRTTAHIAGLNAPVLNPADAIGYAALHAVRHWFRGSLKAFHVYEIAFFLNATAKDDAFWQSWREMHPPELRRVETLSFRLACDWFGCDEPEVVTEEIRRLPPEVLAWFERFAASPVQALYRPNKAELWLHWQFIGSFGGRLRVARRRVLPASLPPREEAGVPGQRDTSARVQVQRAAAYAKQITRRAVFHIRALAPTAWQAVTWHASLAGLGGSFWRFVIAASLFNFGVFVFLLLYNLRLLDLGYRENALGWISSAMTAGSIAGALPAGALIGRLQLRRSLLACFIGVAVLSAVRALATGLPALLATAFATGLVLSVWAVIVPPAVANLTTERNRARGFSVVFASGIAMGIAGGLAGGRLPSLMRPVAGGAADSKLLALLLACLAMALAAIPANRLRLAGGQAKTRGVYPRSAFVVRFLCVMAVWTAAVGAFNPFFNAFFARQFAAPAELIGVVFSGAQLAQVAALLIAPVLLKTLGKGRGIVLMQAAAGLALIGLAGSSGIRAAALFYSLFAALYYMSEPGLYSILMGNVRSEQQTGAASLNFLVVFSAQAVAAAASGMAIARFGYQPTLLAAAGLAIISGLLFSLVVKPFVTR